jgi:LysM repeat protein
VRPPPAPGSVTPLPPAGAAVRIKTHIVKSGDTLAALSRRYRVSLSALQAANPSLDSRRMKIGQAVNIPEP